MLAVTPAAISTEHNFPARRFHAHVGAESRPIAWENHGFGVGRLPLEGCGRRNMEESPHADVREIETVSRWSEAGGVDKSFRTN
jgi:hypothetical protein